MKKVKRILALLLTLCMVFTGFNLTPASTTTAEASDSFSTTVMIDCGRGFYSVDSIKSIIDQMAKYGYDNLMLGFGNDGLRFLLTDMSVTANGTTYADETIRNAITAKNNELAPSATGEWSETDMDTIISYAKEKGITISPMINTPGHATSITAAIDAALKSVDSTASSVALANRNGLSDSGSTTFDVTNTSAVNIATALIQKYIDYFKSKECSAYFNLGMDEYAGNNGGYSSMSSTEKSALSSYLDTLCENVVAAGMTPVAFCDVIGNLSSTPSSMIGINWNGTGLSGHSNINANQNWYYVLGATGNTSTWAAYEKSMYYTQNASVTTTVKGTADAGSLLAIWNDNYLDEDSYVTNINDIIANQATYNPAYFTIASEPETEPDEAAAYTSEESYTVAVGKTKTVSVSGANYAGTYTTDDTSIATVAVTGTDEIKTTATYSSVNNVTASTLANGKTSWTKTRYYYKAKDGNWYPVYAYSSTSGNGKNETITYYWGYSTTDSSSNVTSISSTSSRNSWVSGLYTQSGTSSTTPASTTITFTGVSEGTTSVIIGSVKYNITVTEADLSTISITYYPFISDFAVYPDGTGTSKCSSSEGVGNAQTLTADTADVHSVNGAALSSFVWKNGDWYYEDSSVQTVYWKGMLHSSSQVQVGTKTNMSMTGTEFQYIRYYGGVWSVSNDRENWTVVSSTDELCTYYLQETKVTDEVTTYVKDWAFTTSDASTHTTNTQKALAFAVVYPDGQMSPSTEAEIYSNSTLIYWSTTANMFMRAAVNEVYEIEKITYTTGERVTTSNSSQFQSTDSIKWNKKTTADGSTWYDETTCWDETYGSDPVVDASTIDAFSNTNFTSNKGILVLIYLKPVVTEDSLTVKYVDDTNADDTTESTDILSYTLNVANESTATEKGTFLNRLKQTSTVQSGEFTLDDTAYVENAKGTNETFQKDLQKIPSLMGTSYASGLYEYVKAEISEDGKTLILHYKQKTDIDSIDYVIDFGLGMNIPVSDLGVNTTNATVTVGAASYADTKVDGTNIVYTPKKVLKAVDVFNVYIKYSNETVTKTVKVYPATTVYYEEGFADTSAFTGGDKGTATQQAQKLGSNTDGSKSVYGYDSAYASNLGASSGSEATSSTVGDKLTFSFKGTGVDVYANCKTSTGKFMVKVLNSAGRIKKLAVVNTETAGIYDELGTSEQYELPVFAISGLDYGEYTVQIINDSTDADKTEVDIDGFKVYNTIEDKVSSESPYLKDQEDSPAFYELRDELLFSDSNVELTVDGSESENIPEYSQVFGSGDYATTAVILSDNGDETYTLKGDDLLNKGPKNELFLKAGDALVFNISTERNLQIGLKAVDQKTTCSINEKSVDLNSSTDMFYSIKKSVKTGTDDDGNTYSYQTVTIKNTGSGVLSITKLKVCDDPNASFTALAGVDIVNAISMIEEAEKPVLTEATITAKAASTVYTGKAVDASSVLKAETNSDGKLSYEYFTDKACTKALKGSPKSVGTYYVKISVPETEKYTAAEKVVKLVIKKGTQTIKVKTASKTWKAADLKKAAKTFSIGANAAGKITCKKYAGSSKITVSSAGRVKVKKGTAKGTYTVKVKISAAATSGYNAATIKKTIKVVVK